jgi:anaerobic magnesium-protoporphyrin IX monomethyl ester cyclase
MAQSLRNAGCHEAWIGAESGSQRVLDAMNKGTTVAEIRTARERLRTARIRVGFFIQLGYMGEQLSDILATRDLLHAARPDEIGVSVSYPLPGTKFYELVKAQLGPKRHWQESNDLDMMFHGTYTSDFYRAVRDLLHEQISLQAEHPHEARAHLGAGDGGHSPAELLEHGWKRLLVHEAQFRSPDDRAAASGR